MAKSRLADVPIQLGDVQIQTLNQQIAFLLDHQSDAIALTFITPDGEESITTREFFENAGRYAHALRELGVESGDLIVLVLQHSLEVLYSFWGAIMLGTVPSIFPFLTEKLHPDRYFDSVGKLIQRSGVRAVITYQDLREPLEGVLQGIEGLLPLLIAEDLTDLPHSPDLGNLTLASDDSNQTAFLQHSSGTTGLQKGVMLSHGAVINQIANYSHALQLQPSDVVCSWLPLYHDMGLIAGFIMPIMQGIPLVLMSPFHWIRAPHILLEAIQRHGGTLCWLPNFAYNFLAMRVRDSHLENLDLSSIRAFINCSEPVRADSHATFFERFKDYGLQESALTACYAMAENVFAVTQTDIGQPAKTEKLDRAVFQEQRQAILTDSDSALEMVSSGKAVAGTEVKIVDSDGNTLPERHVGEIILHGNSMLTGYYHLPEATQKAIRDGWYFTGDLGYLADGELFVSGRMKDLIIVGGKNIYPQDIETILNEIEGIKAGRTVAFGVFNDKLGTEDIGVVAELEDDSDEARARIQREVRQRVVQALDVNARYIHLVDAMWLIKTSSGKIARSANRDKFLAETGLG